MNKKNNYLIIISLFLTITLLLSTINVTSISHVFASNRTSTAKAMSVLEGKSKRELKSKDSTKELPMASTTKIMTALVTIENCNDFSKIVKIDKRAIGIEGTSIYLTDNENLTVKELLYGLMLASANDASVALASYIGNGDIDYFIELMNKKAQEIGAFNTHFANTHGLDQENHYTTAYDLALITAEALSNPIFKEIVGMKKIQISGNDKVETRYLKNKEKLLTTYENCIGVKTGFTDNAGRCNVSAVEKNDMLVICVVLNCPDMFEESSKLLDEIFNEYKMVKLLPNYNFITQVKVDGGILEKTNAISKKEFNYPLTEIEKSFIIINSDLPTKLIAPVEKDTAIGTITIKLNDKIIFEDSIYAMDDIEKEYIKNEVEEIIENWAY